MKEPDVITSIVIGFLLFATIMFIIGWLLSGKDTGQGATYEPIDDDEIDVLAKQMDDIWDEADREED